MFPAAEPSSFCSRPTPVVPANPELCDNDESAHEHATERPAARPSAPPGSISDRPTFVPDDYMEPRRESPPCVTIEEETARDEPLAPASLVDPPLLLPRRLPPPLPVAPAAAAARALTVPPSTGHRRVLFARVLFVVLFGAVASLLSFAFRPELAHALGQLHGGAVSATGVK